MLDASHAADLALLRHGQTTAPQKTKDAAAARKAAKNFEAVFAGQMVAHMFAGLKEDALFGGGQAGEMYRSMLNEEYGRVIASTGGIGLADQVTAQILAQQEGLK